MGSYFYICLLKKFLISSREPLMRRIQHSCLLPSTSSCLLNYSNLVLRKPEYSKTDSPVRYAPRKPALSFLYWNVFFPNSYTSWLTSTTKETHLDYEAIFLQPLSFLHTNHGQASTTTNNHYCSLLKEITPPGQEVPIFSIKCPCITHATSKRV